MNKIDRIILDNLKGRFNGGTYYYRLNRLKNAIAKYLPDDLMIAENEPTMGIWSDRSPMSVTIFPSFYENIRNMTDSDIHQQNQILIADFGSGEELSFRSYDDDNPLKFKYTDKGIREIAELATKILLDPDLEKGTFTRKPPKVRLDPKDRKPVKSPFKPVVGEDVVHEKLDGLEIQEYVMETIPTKQLKNKKIGYIGQNITGIIPFINKIGASRYKIGDDVDILLVGELVDSNLQRILGMKNVHVIRIFDQPDMDLARSTDHFYYDWADDHYRMNRKDVTLDRYVKKNQKPDMSKIDKFLDRMVEPQRESVFFEPEVSVYRIDGDREIKLDDFDEYLTVIKKLPVTLAFIYQSPVGMYITVSTYVKGSIPSKRRQKAMKDSLRQISARLDEKLSFLDEDVVAIQNAITVLNKSKKTIRTPYSRTIKAKTDSYPVEVLGQHGASFVEEVAPYLDPKRVFNEK